MNFSLERIGPVLKGGYSQGPVVVIVEKFFFKKMSKRQ